MTAMQSPFTREALVEQISKGLRPKCLLFWGHTQKPGSNGRECLSQWFPAPFSIGGTNYKTAEHYMMAEKARLFGDSQMLDRIIRARTPGEAKKLGRSVRGFSDEVWNQNRFKIVVSASVGKFGQNPDLRDFLQATGRRVLVEASPRDRIWGIGMSQTNPDAQDPSRWRGLNLLGFALMSARQHLAATA
jgi:ribA/ribD-fused uncharacterized protein